MFYIKLDGIFLYNIICKVDCLLECIYEWYRKGRYLNKYLYIVGNNLFVMNFDNYKNFLRFMCCVFYYIRLYRYMYMDSRWIIVELKGRVVCVCIWICLML